MHLVAIVRLLRIFYQEVPGFLLEGVEPPVFAVGKGGCRD
jgi:hypothetical protein